VQQREERVARQRRSAQRLGEPFEHRRLPAVGLAPHDARERERELHADPLGRLGLGEPLDERRAQLGVGVPHRSSSRRHSLRAYTARTATR